MLAELEPRAAELERNRRTFTAFLDTLDDEQWQTIVGSESYSVRQTVAHLAGANKSMVRMAQNWIAGKDNTLRPDFDLTFFNSRQQEKRAGMTNAELVQEWVDSQRGIVDLMETVRPEDLTRQGEHPSVKQTDVAGLFLVMTTHEAQHIAAVMEAVTE